MTLPYGKVFVCQPYFSSRWYNLMYVFGEIILLLL